MIMRNPQLKQILILSIVFLGAFILISFYQKNETLERDKDGKVIANQIGEKYFSGKTI